MMRALLIALLLAGCATPAVKIVDHDGHDHYAPTPAQVAARTSERLETLKTVELAYSGAVLTAEAALDAGKVRGHKLDVVEAYFDRASQSLDHLRAQRPGTVEFIAAMFNFNRCVADLLSLVEDRSHADTNAHAH